jgi:hypothetical protein
MKRLVIIYNLFFIGITLAGCSKDELNILTVTSRQVSISANGNSVGDQQVMALNQGAQ